MKKILYALSALFVLCSCSKEEDEERLNYDPEALYGYWRITEIRNNGTWHAFELPQTGNRFLDVTTPEGEAEFPRTGLTFESNGEYRMQGALWTTSVPHTWQAQRFDVAVYGPGERKPFLTYEVVSLSPSYCQLVMRYGNSSSLDLRCTKVQ